MSPTYWTSSRIINAAKLFGWEIVPAPPIPGAGWSVKKGRQKIMIGERRDGGLLWVKIQFPGYGGSDTVYYPPRYKGKLKLVLGYLEESGWRKFWMTDEWLAWWKSLDHTNCACYGGDSIEETMADMERPAYQQCRSMHCPDCGKPTGSQGHRNCPERTKT